MFEILKFFPYVNTYIYSEISLKVYIHGTYPIADIVEQ